MATSILSDWQSIREDVKAVAGVLAAVENKLEDMATRSEKEIFELHSQTSYLQSRNSELEAEIKRIQNENAEFERIVKAQASEMENVVQARDDALRKLRRTRRVVKDLMNEKKGWIQLESPVERRTSISENQDNSSVADEFFDATSRRSSSTSSSSSSRPSSSGSDRTARPTAGKEDKEPSTIPAVAPVIQSDDTRHLPQKASTSRAALIREKWSTKSEASISNSAPLTQPVRTVPPTRATPPVPLSGNSKAGVPKSNAPTRPASPVQPAITDSMWKSSKSTTPRQPNILRVQILQGQKWKLNTDKPPHLPMLKEVLKQVDDPYSLLGLDEDEYETIEGLTNEATGLRIHFVWEKSCAFIIDPIFFEMLAPAPVESYLVDWAPRATARNGRISKAITRHLKDDDTSPALHVFSFVSSRGPQGMWCYLGAHSFYVAKFVQPLWETLAEKAKEPVVEQIQARQESVDDEGIKALLASGEWPAFCLKLENNRGEHAEMTWSMLQRLDNLKVLEDAE